MKNKQSLTFVIIILVVLCLLCCVAAGVFAAVLWLLPSGQTTAAFPSPSSTIVVPTQEQEHERPTLEPPVASKQPTPSNPPGGLPLPAPIQIPNLLTETLTTLETTIIPLSDPISLAKRLEGKQDLPVSLQSQLRVYEVGDSDTFWVNNSETNEYFEAQATLAYLTDHLYFWIEDSLRYNERDLKALVDTFEQEIYPTTREFFGSEWTPGVDADPHLYILYTRGLGGSVAGYFSSVDEYLPVIHEYSNAHEMFLLDADHVDLGEEFAYSVLAHEFQHMIHWNIDRNEDTWVNEGASELAAFLNGYSIGGHDRIFAQNPDTQLNVWSDDSTGSTENYGASFLFMNYFLDRFGTQAAKDLIAHPGNGLQSIDAVLSELGIKDPLDGAQIDADDFFTDWLITNYLQDEHVSDGRYAYRNYPAVPDFSPTEKITDCPAVLDSQTVHQYGVNYIQISCQGEYFIHFEGAAEVPVLPADPHSGDYAFFSNRGDESDMSLTRKFDFTDQASPLTLTYWTWYDLEQDYDYLYLSASTDGERWQILSTPSGTPTDPTGNSFGWGYNGKSGSGPQWIEEQIDLSQYAGKVVELRFEYVTDAAVNREGFLIDDIAVPEIGYKTNFEQDDGGWQAAGFVRIHNLLPQAFRLALIQAGRNPTVELLEVGPDNRLELPIVIGGNVREVILVITGVTRFTRQEAIYSLEVQSN